MEDAANAGSLAQFFHAKDTELKLTEAGNKTGSADVYERLCERCNNEISKLILGNTLTTESSEKGTQALGTVHKKVEDKVLEADRKYVLNVLNYDMTDILLRMGINTEGVRSVSRTEGNGCRYQNIHPHAAEEELQHPHRRRLSL